MTDASSTPRLPAELDPDNHGLDLLLVAEGMFDSPVVEHWSITDDGAAEWAMRRLGNLRDELDQIANRAAQWRTQIQEWQDKVSAPLLRSALFFEQRLEHYQLQRRMADPDRAKTLTLPSGVVSSRPAVSQFEISEERLQAWAVDRPSLVRVKVEPEIAEIRKMFVEKDDKLVDPESGEIVDGVRVIPPSPAYSVKAKPA